MSLCLYEHFSVGGSGFVIFLDGWCMVLYSEV